MWMFIWGEYLVIWRQNYLILWGRVFLYTRYIYSLDFQVISILWVGGFVLDILELLLVFNDNRFKEVRFLK